jgi:hypothetical protein
MVVLDFRVGHHLFVILPIRMLVFSPVEKCDYKQDDSH